MQMYKLRHEGPCGDVFILASARLGANATTLGVGGARVAAANFNSTCVSSPSSWRVASRPSLLACQRPWPVPLLIPPWPPPLERVLALRAQASLLPCWEPLSPLPQARPPL